MQATTEETIQEELRRIDQALYAAYINTATQNVVIVLTDISKRFGLNVPGEDYSFFKAEGKTLYRELMNTSSLQAPEIVKQLKKQFNFLGYLTEDYVEYKNYKGSKDNQNGESTPKSVPSPVDYAHILKLWVEQLTDLRNYFTHGAHKDISINGMVPRGLEMLYDADWKQFKEWKNYTDKDVEHLLRKGAKGKEVKGFKYTLRKDGKLATYGFIQFVCLWLERKDAFLFLKKHMGFKSSLTKAHKATLDKFTYWRTRLPKARISSEQTDQALFLDMLNDLSRCPQVVYDQLSHDDKETCKVTIENDAMPDEDADNPGIYLTRKSNRFYYYAMRYLETSFKKLKFHIDLGDYCFHSYEQEIQGTKYDRKWIRKVLGFGNLLDYDTSKRPEEWQAKLETLDNRGEHKTYIRETNPHYHFDERKGPACIGMKWVVPYQPDKVWPALPKSTSQEGTIQPPDFWLSLYELPAMVFYQLLKEKEITKKPPAEELINNYRKKLHAFFNEVAKGEHLSYMKETELGEALKKKDIELNWIPEKLRDALLGNSVNLEKKKKRRLEAMIKETAQRLERIGRIKTNYEEDHKVGSKDYNQLRVGDMADYLARDMIRLQPPVGKDKGKPNGTEFQHLQKQLAYFYENKPYLKGTFRLCNLINCENQHPFLADIDLEKHNTVMNFYIDYLRKRKAYLEKCSRQSNLNFHFLKQDKKQTAQELAKAYQESVINLPRGFFLKPIIEALENHESTKLLAEELAKKKKVNTAYIIQQYLKMVKQDGNQEFYNYKRRYKILEKLKKNEKDSADGLKGLKHKELKKYIDSYIDRNNLGAERPEQTAKLQKKYNWYQNNEKRIRLFQTCDIIQYLMVGQLHEKLYKDQGKDKENVFNKVDLFEKYKLKDIKPNAERSILSEQVKQEIKVGKDAKVTRVIVRENMKIKNYGDFRRIVSDRRLVQLLPYIDDHEIAYEAVIAELEHFHEARESTLKEIIDFEKAYFQKHPLKEEEICRKHNDILKEIPGVPVSKMKALRNMICHAEYPKEVEVFKPDHVDGTRFNELKEKGADQQPSPSIADQLASYARQEYDNAKAKI